MREDVYLSALLGGDVWREDMDLSGGVIFEKRKLGVEVKGGGIVQINVSCSKVSIG